jgi:phosphatidylserine decarboxylase
MARELSEILYYRRGAKSLEKEIVLGEGLIKWAYQNRNHQSMVSALIFRSSMLSRLYGIYVASMFSRRKIRHAVEELNIDETEFLEPTESFKSFNAFFIRKLKTECRPYDPNPDKVVSPADNRLFVYAKATGDKIIPVKGVQYSINDLLQNNTEEFHHGVLFVMRLCPADYHRFHFPIDGQIGETREIAGYYHSVNPFALATGTNIFCQNKRIITIIENEIFGKVAMIEIGAFGVGSIAQTYSGRNVKKMQEKGYFKFGGSTIVLIFQKDKLAPSVDLIQSSETGYETLVKAGETIGVFNPKCGEF